MDGVVADYERSADEKGLSYREARFVPGFYLELPVMLGAQDAITALDQAGFEIFFLTKPPSKNPYAASEKLMWMMRHFPKYYDRVIITPDKGCVGYSTDFLVDDHPEWANAHTFRGKVIHFGQQPHENWDAIVTWFLEMNYIEQLVKAL